MRWQTTALLAVILIALGAFYYVYEVRLGPERERAEARKGRGVSAGLAGGARAGPKRERAEARKGRVFSADLADVAELELKRANDTVRARREKDGWHLQAPVTARGDGGKIEET